MSKFYILEEHELFDPNDMSEFAVEFDGDLREFVTEKIEQKSYEHLTWAMLDHMLGTLRIIFEEDRPMSLTDYEVLKGDIHAVKLGINKEKTLKEDEK